MTLTKVLRLCVCRDCGLVIDAGGEAFVGRLGIVCPTCREGDFEKVAPK